ncbi:cytochrome c oxidase assembly factor Coa1 family protein [Corallococcus sp. CA049B]|uniref:cytochrome c oxidase assembly factor Coa1 family protein n=1 Tax=Corallococcus sp. CA049B TaxID=2316730 RepID=UPI001315038D|nr:cytochrome c oxidase assembly factor Coa1 family protein [Corallococcus sp. CA049B]
MPPTSPEGDYAPVPRQGWWSRNWKWAVPVGCLGMMGSCFCFVAIAVGWGYSSFKDMGAYTDAITEAQEDPHVQQALGGSFKPGFPSNTQVSTRNGRTHAEFTVPLDGPKADGNLHAVADKNGEAWTFRTLYVQVEGGQRIDLLDTGETPPEAPEEPLEPEVPHELEPEDAEPSEPPAQQKPGHDTDIEL